MKTKLLVAALVLCAVACSDDPDADYCAAFTALIERCDSWTTDAEKDEFLESCEQELTSLRALPECTEDAVDQISALGACGAEGTTCDDPNDSDIEPTEAVAQECIDEHVSDRSAVETCLGESLDVLTRTSTAG